MERYFIVVVEEFGVKNSSVVEELFLIKDYQQLFYKSYDLNHLNSTSHFPTNPHSNVGWALCVSQSNRVYRGTGVEEFQGLISSSFIADLPYEPWDSSCFSNLKNKAVDIILEWEKCPHFWVSFDTSNNVKIFQRDENQPLVPLNHKLFWRGILKIKDPQNPSNYGQLELAELSYDIDELDLLISRITGVNSMAPAPYQQQQRKSFCPCLEILGAFNARTVPVIFYSSASLVLTVNSVADVFGTILNENVSLLFRLDYSTASETAEDCEKELVGTQSIHFLSHWVEGQLKLFVLLCPERLQQLANVFVRAVATSPTIEHAPSKPVLTNTNCLKLDQIDIEIRRLQLIALKSWLEQNGSIDPSTMEELLTEVALAVVKDAEDRFSTSDEAQNGHEYAELHEADLLKWRLEVAEKKNEGIHDQLLKPTGRTITVDVAHLLRSFNRNRAQTESSPSKNRVNVSVSSRMKPTCDLETARNCTDWPQCTQLKYHGISYNLSIEDEKMAKQGAEYQDKWVPLDAESSSFCNPWSINSSSTYQLSMEKSRPSVAPVGARTPRKQKDNKDLAQLRKSPRLLAKNSSSRPNTRRTPSKKNPSAEAARGNNNKESFKQQLKGVIIRVLADQKITTQDPLFRTCANKLSVICMALLKDSKTEVTPRQMFQVAKSQAKQVIQFVKC